MFIYIPISQFNVFFTFPAFLELFTPTLSEVLVRIQIIVRNKSEPLNTFSSFCKSLNEWCRRQKKYKSTEKCIVYIKTKHRVSSRTSDLNRRIAKKRNLLNYLLSIFFLIILHIVACIINISKWVRNINIYFLLFFECKSKLVCRSVWNRAREPNQEIARARGFVFNSTSFYK